MSLRAANFFLMACALATNSGLAQRVLQILLMSGDGECHGRMHWGKAGWPRYNACFDGSAEFPDWCSFGCAVQVRALLPSPC